MTDPLGALLWITARDVMLWAAAAPTLRNTLFRDGAARARGDAIAAIARDGLVREALQAIAMILDGTPDEPTIAASCAQIARWADTRGHAGVALEFGQAVALILTDDAESAFVVAEFARKHGEASRAESWYRRAVMLARRSGAWSAYAKAFIALGELHEHRGAALTSQKCYLRAERAAKRNSLHALADTARRARAGSDAPDPSMVSHRS